MKNAKKRFTKDFKHIPCHNESVLRCYLTFNTTRSSSGGMLQQSTGHISDLFHRSGGQVRPDLKRVLLQFASNADQISRNITAFCILCEMTGMTEPVSLITSFQQLIKHLEQLCYYLRFKNWCLKINSAENQQFHFIS